MKLVGRNGGRRRGYTFWALPALVVAIAWNSPARSQSASFRGPYCRPRIELRRVDRWAIDTTLTTPSPVSLTASGPGRAVVGATTAIDVYGGAPGAWSLEQTLLDASPYFGLTLAGAELFAGVHDRATDSAGNLVIDGSVKVYRRQPGTTPPWAPVQILEPSFQLPIPTTGTGMEQQFGSALAVDGSTLVVGASSVHSGRGRVFVFEEQNGSWSETQELAPAPDIQDHDFGKTVAISGDTIVVGAPGHGGLGGPNVSGAAFVFVRAAGVWTQQAALYSDVSAPFDGFGTAVAVEGDQVVVRDSPPPATSDASIRLYERSAGAWTYRTGVATPGADFDHPAMQLADGFLVVGRPEATEGGLTSAGDVVLFELGRATLTTVATLQAPTPSANALFGATVSATARTVLVGAPGPGNGAAYLFHQSTTWVPQIVCR